jgi:hypothetical protein
LVIVPGDAFLKPGERMGLTFDEPGVHLFDTTGPRIETAAAMQAGL